MSTLRWCSIAVCGLSLAVGCSRTDVASSEADQALRTQCVSQLRRSLLEQQQWAKVHAAEFLVSLDYRSGVREEFTEQLRLYGDEAKYRIGIWRVLARLDRHDESAYHRQVDGIRSAFLDPTGPDRIHAVESLAKLGYQCGDDESILGSLSTFAKSGPVGGQAYAWWVLLNNGVPEAEERLADLLGHDQPITRQTAAYGLRHQEEVSAKTTAALDAAWRLEPKGSQARVYLMSAAWRHRSAESKGPQLLESELLNLLDRGSGAEQYEIARLAADVGDAWKTDLAELLRSDNIDEDVKASVAHALCRIGRRTTARMPLLDWCVVGLYGFVMLAIGIYYAKQTNSAGDYLLGGGNMRSWMVGLSLFATMLSTLSYLAWPGEMIKNGPVILLGYASYPLVYFVVGWYLIPHLMHLKVTSAYEILELRFGISIRMLGSILFLSLRFLWMASIIYWTTAVVLIPAAGIHEDHTSLIAMALGFITVVYTSLGGLRAVVVTDVIQTFILFAGAVVSLILITHALGSVSAWLPTQWSPHWPAPKLWFDFNPDTRATLANAMLGTFAWYVCTAGADQMAIQRYLATKNVSAARRTLAVSLAADFVVIVFLGLMGLALLAFFSAYPDRMADGQTVYANADKLFPRFVVIGLPLGMSGLVIAGLLAAAMSSLSSGVNSSAAVVSEDLIRRFRRREIGAADHVKLVRWTSVFVGVVVVILSSQIGNLQGNMLEVVYKVANLFTAPLFYLFFMAIFVKRANVLGTWVGSIAGIVTAIVIAFWRELFGVQGISFLWIIPSSFVVSVCVGTLVSVIVGRGTARFRVEAKPE